MTSTRRHIAAALAVLMLMFGTAMSPAHAQTDNVNAQRGLINVHVVVTDVIEDIVIKDINVAVAAAANIMANVCGNNIGVAALIAALEQQGGEVTCDNTAEGQEVVVTQN